ncbi:MAG: acetyl-CoA carboxylase carboxyl transferase subunit alpha, partial [Sphaerochaetaceae bacterium]
DIIPEVPEGAHKDPLFTANAIKETILKDLDVLCAKPTANLVRYRIRKIRGIGEFEGSEAWWTTLMEVFKLTVDLR